MFRYNDNDSRLQLRESLVEALYMASNNRYKWIGLISNKMEGPCNCVVSVSESRRVTGGIRLVISWGCLDGSGV